MHEREPVPLFVCYANCCRSVLAKYLYESLFPGSRALSAGH
jgi:protein-tyrosine-phosphatase